MSTHPVNGVVPGTMQCPTCRATQPWSNTCRRCKSDLTLLLDLAAAYESHRRACLRQIRAGDGEAALENAERCLDLRATLESHRLVALSALVCGDWYTAQMHGRLLVEEQEE